MSKRSMLAAEKPDVYSSRVLIGNWYEATKLEEHKLHVFRNQMENGDLMLARYRKMIANLNTPTVLTKSTGTIAFGAKISLLAPHVLVAESPSKEYKGLFLGGRISADEIMYTQDLRDNCVVVAHQDLVPAEKHSIVITSADYCNHECEVLKYNQEFLLTLSKTAKTKFKMNLFMDNMKKGDIMLARYRKMSENINAPTTLTRSTGSIAFGDMISLLAPHVQVTYPAKEDVRQGGGLLLGGRVTPDEILYNQDLIDGCTLAALSELQPKEKSTFVITSADYCNRKGEQLKYNQEFILTLAKTVDKKPLYVRFDPNPIPGLCGKYQLFMSEHAVTNTRWRILPVQNPNITRFEQEGKPVPINKDIIINHCSTNINLGVDTNKGGMGFYGKIYALVMKTCLDVFGRELPNNVWQIYIPPV